MPFVKKRALNRGGLLLGDVAGRVEAVFQYTESYLYVRHVSLKGLDDPGSRVHSANKRDLLFGHLLHCSRLLNDLLELGNCERALLVRWGILDQYLWLEGLPEHGR